MICVNGGYLVSDIFNNIDRKTWREIKETLQWPPMEINWWYVPIWRVGGLRFRPPYYPLGGSTYTHWFPSAHR